MKQLHKTELITKDALLYLIKRCDFLSNIAITSAAVRWPLEPSTGPSFINISFGFQFNASNRLDLWFNDAQIKHKYYYVPSSVFSREEFPEDAF